jgi:hypothetical protein
MFEYIVLQANTFEVLGLTYQPVPKLPETREGARSQSVYYYFTRTLQKCTPTIRKISLTSNNLPDFLCCGGGRRNDVSIHLKSTWCYSTIDASFFV